MRLCGYVAMLQRTKKIKSPISQTAIDLMFKISKKRRSGVLQDIDFIVKISEHLLDGSSDVVGPHLFQPFQSVRNFQNDV